MTPSQSIILTAHASHVVTDRRGRRLTVRPLTALDTLRLLKAAGPSLAQNEAWLAMAGLVFCISDIDGVPVPAPTTESQIEALVDRLGEDGLAAIAQALETAEAAPTPDTLGNSRGTPS